MRKIWKFIFWNKYSIEPDKWPEGYNYSNFPKHIRLKYHPRIGEDISHYDNKTYDWWYFRVTGIDYTSLGFIKGTDGRCHLSLENLNPKTS